MSHLLLNNAYIYDLPKLPMNMNEFFYDHQKGYWVNLDNSTPNVLDPNFKPARSKKFDIETGEDKKGE